MSVDFKKLYEQAISYWPESIFSRDKIALKKGGLRVPCLIKVHDEIEEKICLIEENYTLRHMDWAIYTVLHGMAKNSDRMKINEINIDEVNLIFHRNINHVKN